MLAALETDDLKTVREHERLRIEATRQNDADVLAPLLHEQLIYVNSAGAVFDKELSSKHPLAFADLRSRL
jgi:SHS2 domain-containing protein